MYIINNSNIIIDVRNNYTMSCIYAPTFSSLFSEMITFSLFPSGQQKSEEVSVEVDDYDDELEAFKK